MLDGGVSLTAKGRSGLIKSLRGVNPEDRLQRLRKLGSQKTPLSAGKTTSATTNETANGTLVNGVGSIVDMNRLEGVDEYMLEADINLTEEQLEQLEAAVNSSARRKRQASKTAIKWTNNKVFYYFDPSIGTEMRGLVAKATHYISARTCVDFAENAAAPNRVLIYDGGACNSFVGMIGGEQPMSLTGGCNAMGIVAHEFTHALGVWHMQMRNDRDQFITLDLTNVPPQSQFNYDKLTAADIVNYTPYEYGSMMHYDTQSFATSGSSIIPRNGLYLRTLGSHAISFFDISLINYHYKCNGKCATKGANCVNGGVRNPRNCNICNCPAGYGGALCNLRPAGCGETLVATAAWKMKTFTIGNAAIPTVRDTYTVCNHWIKAPAGKKVQIRVKSMTGVNCLNGCWAQAIEPKIAAKLPTNPRICCSEQLDQLLTSNINPTPIVTYSRYLSSTFTFAYKFI